MSNFFSNFAIAHGYLLRDDMLRSKQLFPNLLGEKLEVELHKIDA